jgi:hypothetical protein
MTKDFSTPFCCSKFPWARDRISPKVIDNLGKKTRKGLLSLPYDKI